MSTLELAIRIIAGLLLVGANAFFVVIEFALTRLRQYETSEIAGDAHLEQAWKMTEELEIYLTGCQLGISTSSVLLGVVAEPALTRLLQPVFTAIGLGASSRSVSVVLAVVVIQLVHKIWGEQAPTYLGVERPLAVARVCARPLHYWVTLTRPVIVAGDGLAKSTLRLFGVEITRSWAEEEVPDGSSERPTTSSTPSSRRQEQRRALLRALGGAPLAEDRRDEVLGAFDMDVVTVADVMIPWDDTLVVDVDAPFAENRRQMATGGKTRYPAVDRDGAVLGAVYLQEVFREHGELTSGRCALEDLVREVPRVAAEMPVSDLVDELQAAHHEMAVVCHDDEHVGMVTVMDALETISGAVTDPLDRESSAQLAV